MLPDEWDAEYFKDSPSTFHIRESYALNSQSHDPDTPTYMEALSGENVEEYFKAMDDKIQSLMRRDTWEIVSRKSVADHKVLPRTWSFKFKRKPDWKISKFKAQYCVRGDLQKRMSPEPLNSYSKVVQWVTVRIIFILYFILAFQSQSIDLKNAFAQADILSGEPVFIERPRDFKSDVGQYDVFLRFKKSYMVKPKPYPSGMKS